MDRRSNGTNKFFLCHWQFDVERQRDTVHARIEHRQGTKWFVIYVNQYLNTI